MERSCSGEVRSLALEQFPPFHLTRVDPRGLLPSKLAPASPLPLPPHLQLFSAVQVYTTLCMALSEPGIKLLCSCKAPGNIFSYLTLNSLEPGSELGLSPAPGSCIAVQVNQVLLEKGLQCFPALWQADDGVVRLQGGRRQG